MAAPEVLAYAAGLFDGEGTVYLRNRPPHYTIGVLISQTDRRPLDFMALHWQGAVLGPYGTYKKNSSYNWKPIFQWGLHGTRAFNFLQDIVPFCQIKQDQIYLLWDYPFTAGGIMLTDEIIAKRREIYEAVKAAKQVA